MEQASRATSKLCQVHKPHRSAGGHDQIRSKSVSTKVQAGNKLKTKAVTILSQKPYQQPDIDDGQIISSKQAVNKSSSQVWDCGSSLYDSFELNSFNRQLDSAIKASSRTLSMPHLPEPLPAMTITNSRHQLVYSKKVGTISKSLKNALRSVFGWSSSTTIVNNNTTISPLIKTNSTRETTHTRDSFQVYNGSNSMRVLTTIPELQETGGHHAKFSMEATAIVRRSASERFSTAPPPAIVNNVSCGSR
ncbi:hypothetical protein QQ045_015725 [Rhodiola kirilowii]